MNQERTQNIFIALIAVALVVTGLAVYAQSQQVLILTGAVKSLSKDVQELKAQQLVQVSSQTSIPELATSAHALIQPCGSRQAGASDAQLKAFMPYFGQNSKIQNYLSVGYQLIDACVNADSLTGSPYFILKQKSKDLLVVGYLSDAEHADGQMSETKDTLQVTPSLSPTCFITGQSFSSNAFLVRCDTPDDVRKGFQVDYVTGIVIPVYECIYYVDAGPNKGCKVLDQALFNKDKVYFHDSLLDDLK